jgi:hypothetical protein
MLFSLSPELQHLLHFGARFAICQTLQLRFRSVVSLDMIIQLFEALEYPSMMARGRVIERTRERTSRRIFSLAFLISQCMGEAGLKQFSVAHLGIRRFRYSSLFRIPGVVFGGGFAMISNVF